MIKPTATFFSNFFRGSLSNIHTGLNRGRASSLNPNSIRGIPAASTPSQHPAAAGGGSVSLKAAALLNNSRLQSAAAASTASPQLSRRQLGSAASGKPAIFEDHQGEETGANGETTQVPHFSKCSQYLLASSAKSWNGLLWLLSPQTILIERGL